MLQVFSPTRPQKWETVCRLVHEGGISCDEPQVLVSRHCFRSVVSFKRTRLTEPRHAIRQKSNTEADISLFPPPAGLLLTLHSQTNRGFARLDEEMFFKNSNPLPKSEFRWCESGSGGVEGGGGGFAY